MIGETKIVTLQSILDDRAHGRIDLAEFLDAVWEFAEDTDNEALKDAVDRFDTEAESDVDHAEENFELAVKRALDPNLMSYPDNSIITNGYPDTISGAQLATYPKLAIKDFNSLKAYGTPRFVGKINIGTVQAPVWEERYVIDRHEIDPLLLSDELQLYKNRLKQGATFSLTRFYLTRTVSGLTVVPNATWNVTSGNAVYNLATAYDGTPIQTVNSGAGTAGQKMLNKTFVSASLLAQTIKCSVIIQLSTRHGQAAPSDIVMVEHFFLRVVNNDGTVAAEIASATSSAIPNNSSSVANKQVQFVGLNFPVAAGQRICFGVGGSFISGTGSTYIRQNFGAQPTVTLFDLPYGEEASYPNGIGVPAPWIEFSQPIKFQ